LPLPFRFEHFCAVAQDRRVFTQRQRAREVVDGSADVTALEEDGCAVRQGIGEIGIRRD